MIHPTALVSREARIDPSAEVGPYVVIEGRVSLGAGCRVKAHAYLTGWTDIAENNLFLPGVVIGEAPQDLKYRGEESYVRIGSGNVFREHTQVHRGSAPGSATTIGNDNYLMHNAHVAHNCEIGNRVIVGGGTLLAGHVSVGDQAFVSGNCVVHQFVRIGRLALLRGLSRTSRDVPPFCIIDGTHTVRGVNAVGLRRAGFTAEQVKEVKQAMRKLFWRRLNLSKALAELESTLPSAEVREIIEFIRASTRGVCVGPKTALASPDERGDPGVEE